MTEPVSTWAHYSNKPEFPWAEAEEVAIDTWFVATCPHCQRLTLVSLYASDGELNDCDICPGQFWFRAGAFAERRKRD